MNRFEILDILVESGNGYLCTSQILELKILSRHLQNTSAIGIWSELQGVYLAADAWPDELYLLSLTNSRIVFSHETALFLHVLMECEPKYTSVTVKAGYNASHLRNKGIRVY